MRSRTLTNLIADVRQRTNMETSTFVTDAEIQELLNVGLAELWARLCQNGGQPFYRATSALAVTQGQPLYNLPVDFLALQGIEATINGWTGRLDSFMPAQRAGLVNSGNGPWGQFTSVRYRLQGNTIEFLPATETFNATLFYTPTCPRLVDPSDTFDGFDGYEVAAIYGACASVQAKEETDPSFYAGERERIYRLIDSMATARDMSAPERVQDVRGDDFNEGGWIGGWYR